MRLSVAIGTYNGAAYLPAQLASIAGQTRGPDEIVICDDCSTDATRAQIEAFARTTPIPVQLLINEQNLGSTKTFERAIGQCSGDIIALCDQDDVWRRDKLQLIEESFVKAPAAGLVFSDAEIVDADLHPLGRGMWAQLGLSQRKLRLFETGRALDLLIPGWTVTGAMMAFRSKFRDLILPIPDDLPMIHDGWIALAIGAVADVVLIKEPLVKYRQHSRQQIGAPRSPDAPPTGFQAVEAALRRHTSFADLRIILAALRQRLNAHEKSFDCRRAYASIENYSDHIDARTGMPPGKLSRIPAIVRELMRLRYHRYSKGFRSAAKDLVS